MQIGRVVATLERIGELDNTLIFVTADNGASGEGGLAGTFNETYVLNGLQTPFEANLRHYDNWGDATTPTRTTTRAGPWPATRRSGTSSRASTAAASRTHWSSTGPRASRPRARSATSTTTSPTSRRRSWRSSASRCPRSTTGSSSKPMDGVSMAYSFDDADAPNRKKRQYYEMFGNRAIWVGRLEGGHAPREANALGRQRGTAPSIEDEWELYHVAEDFSREQQPRRTRIRRS